MKKVSKWFAGAIGGLFMVLGLGASAGRVEASLGAQNIESITNKTPLYLAPAQHGPNNLGVLAEWHYSHSSHASHYSHESHASHYSHQSGYN